MADLAFVGFVLRLFLPKLLIIFLKYYATLLCGLWVDYINVYGERRSLASLTFCKKNFYAQSITTKIIRCY
jgi:hypothetical protein